MAALNAAERRRRFERLSSIREIVFGVQDGVLTTAGVLSGLSGAIERRHEVILAALAASAAGALSMAAGAYLGTKAEAEVMASELDRARRETAGEPYAIQESLLEQLAAEGLSREASYRVVKLLSSAPQALAATVEAKVYGLSQSLIANPLIDGLMMGVAFVLGAMVPLLPYCLIAAGRVGLPTAEVAAAVALFGVGYFEGWLAERRAWLSGMRFLSIALGAALAGYLAGIGIAWLGGVSSLPATP